MTKAVVIIGAIITTPIAVLLQIVGLFFKVPNTKIIYKSGHVEYYFFQSLIFSNDSLGKSISWEASTLKKPIFINVEEIESIVKIW